MVVLAFGSFLEVYIGMTSAIEIREVTLAAIWLRAEPKVKALTQCALLFVLIGFIFLKDYGY